jgi:hypothetical protein
MGGHLQCFKDVFELPFALGDSNRLLEPLCLPNENTWALKFSSR